MRSQVNRLIAERDLRQIEILETWIRVPFDPLMKSDTRSRSKTIHNPVSLVLTCGFLNGFASAEGDETDHGTH